MITKRDIVFIIAPFFATYFVRDLVTADVGKLICSFEAVKFKSNLGFQGLDDRLETM